MADAAVAVEETQQLEEAEVSPLEESLLARAQPVAFTSPFEAEMAAARAQLGDDLVNLASGDPDLPTPAHITAAAVAAIEGGQHHYTPKNGLPALRAAIASHLQRTIGMQYSADEICATAGVQEAMISCFLALTSAGDEVLVPAPTYLSYQKQTALTGAICVDVECKAEHDFIVQPADIEALITPRTKILVHVSPNNPTGAVTPPEVVREIAALAIKHDLVVLSDEIYSDMMYGVHEHLSIATLPGMRGRTVVLNGCSKAFAMTGWRVGYLAAPAGFVEAITAIAGQLSLSVATPSQYAAIAALSGPMDAVNEMMEVYSERREYMIGEFAKMGFAVYGGHGGYIALLDTLSGCGLSAPEFSLRLLKETGVQIGSWGAGMSGEVEHESGRFARISWLLPMDELAIAMDKIAAFVGRVKAEEEEGEAAAGGGGGGAKL